jgi:ABC-type polysaccharide transport system permease subunit
MIEITRETIAYTIIAIIVVISVPVIIRMQLKRHRDRLRRRGIKRHGH